MAASLSNATDLSIEHIKRQIDDYYSFHEIEVCANGCHRWVGKYSGGYVSKHFKLINRETHKEKNIKLALHIVVCFLKYRRIPVKGAIDCSHLCHDKNCLNPDHLVLEPRDTNNLRKNCKKAKRCSHHHESADCIFN